YRDAPCLRSTSATVEAPLRSISFCPMMMTVEEVTGMRLGLTFWGMSEPVIRTFSSDADLPFCWDFDSFFVSFLPGSAEPSTTPAVRQIPAIKAARWKSRLECGRTCGLEMRDGFFMITN